MLVYCRWEHRIKRRYYEVRIERDLFGWGITRIWGGLASSRGRTLHTPCDSFEEACHELEKTANRREKRGYRRIVFKRVP